MWYTPISDTKTVQQKLSTIVWPGKQRKPKIISTRIKLTTGQTGKKKLKQGANWWIKQWKEK